MPSPVKACDLSAGLSCWGCHTAEGKASETVIYLLVTLPRPASAWATLQHTHGFPHHPNTFSPLIRPAALPLFPGPTPTFRITGKELPHLSHFGLSHCLWKATRGCQAELFDGKEAGVSSSREAPGQVLFGCRGFPEWPRAAQACKGGRRRREVQVGP